MTFKLSILECGEGEGGGDRIVSAEIIKGENFKHFHSPPSFPRRLEKSARNGQSGPGKPWFNSLSLGASTLDGMPRPPRPAFKVLSAGK